MIDAVFLDRDGTVVVEKGYITDPDELELIPGSAAAVARLNAAGAPVFLITNQAGVARGLFDERRLEEIHFRLIALLGAEGARLNGIYYCPHHPDGEVTAYACDCDCRKPSPGMIERAAREHGIDLGRSVMIGDALRDLQAGRAAGVRTILVRTGYGREVEAARGTVPEADEVVTDLAEAVDRVLAIP